MKRFIFFTGALIGLFIASCKSQVINASGPQPTKEPTVYKGVTDNSCAVEMAFGSYGSGIDGASFEKITKLIEEWKLKSTAKTIGREGETRICLPLTELKGKKKTEFINQLKKIAKEGQLVSISVR
jgi:hypothetical protein